MIDFKSLTRLQDLDPLDIHLVHQAEKATENAYAPYSNFYVGAAVLLNDGSIVTGANQENASYPLCMCAERVALYSVAAQYPKKTIQKMVVVARRGNEKEWTSVTCCGACRQVMLEFENRQQNLFEVIMRTSVDQWIIAPSAASLLPLSFTKASL